MSDDLKAIAESLERIEKLLEHQVELQVLQMRERSIDDKREYDRSVREWKRRIERDRLSRRHVTPGAIYRVANAAPSSSQDDDFEIKHIMIEEQPS